MADGMETHVTYRHDSSNQKDGGNYLQGILKPDSRACSVNVLPGEGMFRPLKSVKRVTASTCFTGQIYWTGLFFFFLCLFSVFLTPFLI